MPDTNLGLNLKPTEEERAKYRATLVEIADRSIVGELFNVKLPSELYGEWHGIDDASQLASKMQGFRDGSEYVNKSAFTHITSEGGRVGDVRFMVIERWRHEENLKHKQEIIARKNNLRVDAPTIEAYNSMRRDGINPMENQHPEGKLISGTQLAAELKTK